MVLKNYSIILDVTLQLAAAIDRKDRVEFQRIFDENKTKLHNCSIGNRVLEKQVEMIYARALRAFA